MLLLLGVLVDCLVALDAVKCSGLCIVFRESWGVLLASRRSDLLDVLPGSAVIDDLRDLWFLREIFLRDRSRAMPRTNSITARDLVNT